MISIVIPAYNSERFLALTLESVLAQTFSDWELVIVDDGSQDSTPQIIRRFVEQDARIRAIAQANGGVAAARNRGYEATNPAAPFVIFLDNDDTWEPDALQTLHQALLLNPDAAAATGICRAINAEGDFLREDSSAAVPMVRTRRGKIEPYVSGEAIDFEVIVCQNPIISPGMTLIRRLFLQRAGPWDQAVAPADDWDMWARLTLYGPILMLPHAVLRYRMHGNNASRQSDKMKRGERAFYRKTMALPSLDATQKRMVRIGAWNHEYGLFRGRRRWALEALSQKKLALALKQERHALIHYARAFQLHYIFRV